MQAPQQDQQTKPRIVAALKERLGDRLLAALSGSRARGTARSDSDWDALAVATDLPDALSERARLLSGAPLTPTLSAEERGG